METETPGKTFLRFCFSATALRHEAGRSLDKEIVGAHWLTRAELEACRARHRSPLVLESIDDFERGQRYPLSLLRARLRE